ncbi:MAG: hypothetical protein FWE50_01610 [Alphaproteobacteria bacterium]|nr:hypothetical protein [Alphaproteobacteria bacterium]
MNRKTLSKVIYPVGMIYLLACIGIARAMIKAGDVWDKVSGAERKRSQGFDKGRQREDS